MTITWHGDFTIKIQTQGATIMLDPCAPQNGLKPLRAKADYVALTNPEEDLSSNISAIQGDPIIINSPGEYSFEHASLFAEGWHDDHGREHNIQRWYIEDITLLHVGALESSLDETQLKELEKTNIDILLVPVGGGTSLDRKQALDIVSTIEPRVVIPIHYKIPKLKTDLTTPDDFIKDMGGLSEQESPKYKVSTKNLPAEGMQTIKLSVA